jgi:hypothetical protein
METYNHHSFGALLASSLKQISHTQERPRHFTAFGLEDLYNFTDKLSSITGMVLISVDGCDSDSKVNGAGSLNDRREYAFIVATNTNNDRPETIDSAIEACRLVAKQIRNKLLLDSPVLDCIDSNTQINGIGPIGDNYYGACLFFAVIENENFSVDESYWQ